MDCKKEMGKKGNILFQKYELGRLLGQGTFAKVYYARHTVSGQSAAIKIIDKEKVLKVGMIDQIIREISVMRLVKHPNIVQLYEVMASKSKIYFAMEYVKGGELFNKIAKGRLQEDQARHYFQQLISAIDFCHSRGVYHRDLKPENLLLDEHGNLKIADFGLSALRDSKRQDGLLHTTCGTPGYVAPEVIKNRGYDGSKADVWSCGVVLYVLLAGFLPFNDTNLMELYRKINKGDFKCPVWIPPEVRKLLSRILDPSPLTRISMSKLKENSWVKKGFKNVDEHNDGLEIHQLTTPRDVQDAFNIDFDGSTSSSSKLKEKEGNDAIIRGPMNAFDIISSSPGFDLSNMFEKDQRRKSEARFTTSESPSKIVSRLENIADKDRKFSVLKKDGMMKLHSNKEGRKGQLKIDAEIFEVSPALHVLEVKKTNGDTIEYNDFCKKKMEPALKDIVWSWQQPTPNSTSTSK